MTKPELKKNINKTGNYQTEKKRFKEQFLIDK